jgi:hypothetical protein
MLIAIHIRSKEDADRLEEAAAAAGLHFVPLPRPNVFSLDRIPAYLKGDLHVQDRTVRPAE